MPASLPAYGFLRAGVDSFLNLVLRASGLAYHRGLFRFLVQLETIFGYGRACTAAGALVFVNAYCLCHSFSFRSVCANFRAQNSGVDDLTITSSGFSVNPNCSVPWAFGCVGVTINEYYMRQLWGRLSSLP
jgi:hypothetical protein